MVTTGLIICCEPLPVRFLPMQLASYCPNPPMLHKEKIKSIEEEQSSMPRLTMLCTLLVLAIIDAAADGAQDEFIYPGFKPNELLLDGAASITQDGILSLTKNGGSNSTGHGFYTRSLLMDGPDYGVRLTSFSTTFVFSITPYFSNSSGDEMAFVVSSTTNFSDNNIVPVAPPSFFAIVLGFHHDKPVCIVTSSLEDDWNCPLMPNHEALLLSGGKPVQLWADYNGTAKELNVTVALIRKDEPMLPPLLSYMFDMSDTVLVLGNSLAVAYAGFSASTGDNNGATTHQVLGWSFSLEGPAQPLNYSLLQQLQLQASNRTPKKNNLVKWFPATVCTLTILAVIIILVLHRRCKNRAEELEEGWVAELGPQRFSHKALRRATNGFSSKQLLEEGGFGRVYKGALAEFNTSIAVKRISAESKHGLEQFMAEIVILGRLRHRNLVRLIGYCRHKDELLLVYEHMPNGSLDRYLHVDSRDTLIWSQRFHIIKGVASGLLYLHEDWEQVIVHRDIKASNVLLDAEMNGRLGDFGLARLHDHGADAHTTHVAGTRGYLAPELLRLGKATRATDVFAFGAFILEVACGRRPLGLNARGEPLVLMEWVPQVWASGGIVYAMDPRLQDYAAEEAELVLKLGLLCSHPLPAARPGMRLVMQYLDGDVPFPEFLPEYLSITDVDQVLDKTPSVATTITGLSGGR